MEFVNCFSSHLICSAERPTGHVPGRHGHRGSRKRSSNPYAERGLDRFALLSADLEAKRKKLVAQLGTHLSVVRFVVGSDRCDWIPVIICPTLSKSEIRTLEKTATRLISEDKPAVERSADVQHAHTAAAPIQECNIVKEHDLHHSGEYRPALVSVAHADDTQHGTLNYVLAASERCLCMVVFMFSIAADIVSNAVLSKWHAVDPPATQGNLPSTAGTLRQEGDNPSSSNMSSSSNVTSLPRIRTPASVSAKAIKVITPSHPTAHARALPKLHIHRHNRPGFSTAPSTPRDSRQAEKSFKESVSFPHHHRNEAPRSGTANNSTISKSLSLPKASRSQEHAAHRSSTTSKAKQAVRERERKEQSEKLGQALTGAWLALGLGGLVMGYIPAILCVACWWYALPSLRKAVGDKPHVKSHHHHR